MGYELFIPAIIGTGILPVLLAASKFLNDLAESNKESSKRLIQKAESSHKFKQIFDDIINKKIKDKPIVKNKLIITVDNLDRCDEKSAVKILSHIKTFMGKENCIYLIPCDETALIHHLKTEYGNNHDNLAKEFLRKFFQIIINVPPQIKGDLDNYVSKQMEKFSEIPFDDYVKEVLITGVSKNPRKLRQYLYNLAILYKIAKIREGENISKGVLTKGIITEHTSYLAKIIVIKEEWPAIFENIQKRETLLNEYEQYLDGTIRRDDQSLVADIEILFNKNPDFEDFLRATSLVTVDDTRPFIRLSQESFESLSVESEILNKKARENNVDYVKNSIRKLSESEIDNCAKSFLFSLDHYISNKKIQFAFNLANVILEIYDMVSPQIQTEIIDSFSKNIPNTSKLRSSLHVFDAQKLFPIIFRMKDNLQEILLLEYCKLLSAHTPPKLDILHQFMYYHTKLSPTIIEEFDDALARLGGSREVDFFNLVDLISDDDHASKKLLGKRTFLEFVNRLDPKKVPWQLSNISLFLKLRKIASSDSKEIFVTKMAQALADTESMKSALDVLNNLDKNDYDTSSATKLCHSLLNIIKDSTFYEHRKSILPIVFTIFDFLNERIKNGLLNALNPYLLTLDHAKLSDLVTLSKENKSNILFQGEFLDAIVNGIRKQPLNDKSLIILLTETKTTEVDKIAQLVMDKTVSCDHNQISLIISILKQILGKTPKKTFNQITKTVINRLQSFARTESHRHFLELLAVLPQCENDVLDLFGNEAIKWLLSDNTDDKYHGIELITRSFDSFSPSYKSQLANNILQDLEKQLSLSHDKLVNKFLTMLTQIQSSFDNQQIMKTVDTLIPQIKSSKSIQIQKQILLYLKNLKLTHLAKIEKPLLDLSRKTTDAEILNLAKEVSEKYGILTYNNKILIEKSIKTDQGQMPKELTVSITVDVDENGESTLSYEVFVNKKSKIPCSDHRIHIQIDGKPIYTTEWFGYVDRADPLPFETDLIKLKNLTIGKQELTIQPEGRVGGCNQGFLAAYKGFIHTYKKSNKS